MQRKVFTKLTLDIILTTLFIILIYPRETGLTFHEIAGLSIGALFIFHMVLNWSWVKSVTKNLFNPKVKAKTKLFYLLNTISFIAVSTIIITGIQISEVLFPSQGMISHTTVLLHKWVSYSCLGLFGLHLALHWRFFTQTIPRAFKASARPWGKIALNMGAVVLVFGLLYSQITANAIGNTDQPIARQEQKSTDNQDYYNQPRPSDDRLPPAKSSSAADSYNNSPQDSILTAPVTPSNSGGSGSSIDEKTNNNQSNSDTSISNNTDQPDSSDISTGNSSNSTDGNVTLAQFLSGMFCNGCDKRCCLLTPRCDRGIPQQEAATQQYQALYGTSVTEQ